MSSLAVNGRVSVSGITGLGLAPPPTTPKFEICSLGGYQLESESMYAVGLDIEGKLAEAMMT